MSFIRMAEPKRFLRRRYSLLVSSIVLGLLNVAVALSGYGAFWIYGFPFLVLVIVIAQLPLSRKSQPSPFSLWKVLVLCLASYSGVILGSLGRRVQSLPLRRSCDQLSELLERHRSESGGYPVTLESLPELKRSADSTRIREGHFAKGGGILLDSVLDEFSETPTLYLAPDHYLWLIPVERPLPISFTKFHVYLKSNEDVDWRYEDIGWHLIAIQ
jgi:hypothetical protein